MNPQSDPKFYEWEPIIYFSSDDFVSHFSHKRKKQFNKSKPNTKKDQASMRKNFMRYGC